MTLDPTYLQPIITLLAGILILAMPNLLSDIVAIYLLLLGIFGLLSRITR